MLLASWGCSRGRDADLPRRYRNIEVPQVRLASDQARARGRHLFLEHCALCHGVHADGHGIRREGLNPPPADFTNPTWRRQITPRHVYFAIREGVPGTGMPSWKALGKDETWDLVAYVLSVGESR